MSPLPFPCWLNKYTNCFFFSWVSRSPHFLDCFSGVAWAAIGFAFIPSAKLEFYGKLPAILMIIMKIMSIYFSLLVSLSPFTKGKKLQFYVERHWNVQMSKNFLMWRFIAWCVSLSFWERKSESESERVKSTANKNNRAIIQQKCQ